MAQLRAASKSWSSRDRGRRKKQLGLTFPERCFLWVRGMTDRLEKNLARFGGGRGAERARAAARPPQSSLKGAGGAAVSTQHPFIYLPLDAGGAAWPLCQRGMAVPDVWRTGDPEETCAWLRRY